MDGFGILARLDLLLHAVAEQIVDGFVVVVEVAAVVAGRYAEIVDCFADMRRTVPAFAQVFREQGFFDVAVAFAVGPVAEVAIAEFIAKQGDDAVLRGAFWLADIHINRIFPVKRFCIMPCLSWLTLASLVSSATISASMSARTVAMAICSALRDGTVTSIAITCEG